MQYYDTVTAPIRSSNPKGNIFVMVAAVPDIKTLITVARMVQEFQNSSRRMVSWQVFFRHLTDLWENILLFKY